MNFKFIKTTSVRGVNKDRWECPVCRSNKSPECRFNVSIKKRGSKHKCRFCKIVMILNYKEV